MITISSDVIRGYNDTIILYLLLDRPSYGYEISRMIRSLSDGKYIIKETTLYSAFTRMEKNREKCEEWNLTKEVIEHFISPTGKRALPGA